MGDSAVAASISPSLWPAICSACAAIASALAAWFSLTLNRRNARAAARPDIMLLDWGFKIRATSQYVTIGKITNFGKGPALQVGMTVRKTTDTPVVPMVTHAPIFVLPPGESETIDWDVELLVDHGHPLAKRYLTVPPPPIFLLLTIHFWDQLGRFHQIDHRIFTSPGHTGRPLTVATQVHRNVILRERTYRARPGWWPGLKRWFWLKRIRFRDRMKTVPGFAMERIPRRAREELSNMRRRLTSDNESNELARRNGRASRNL